MAKAGPKLKLDNKKLKALFSVMMVAPTYKYVAYALSITQPETVSNYYHMGKALEMQYEKELEPLNDIIPFDFEQIFENRKEEFEAEFAQLYDLEPNTPIPDRLYKRHKDFMLNEKRKFVERNIERKERELLEEIKLSEDPRLDEDYKLLIRFSRIFYRGRCVIEMGLLNSVTENGMSSKNAQLGFKLLQTYNKEEFGEVQQVQHSGTIEVNNKSILGIALQYEKEQREQKLALEQKNTQVIDVTPVNLLEQKSED